MATIARPPVRVVGEEVPQVPVPHAIELRRPARATRRSRTLHHRRSGPSPSLPLILALRPRSSVVPPTVGTAVRGPAKFAE